jgi:hypothetical protein
VRSRRADDANVNTEAALPSRPSVREAVVVRIGAVCHDAAVYISARVDYAREFSSSWRRSRPTSP